MTQLRFPNAVSDIERFVRVFVIIARGTQGRESFGLDLMTEVVTQQDQASSQGAYGALAVQRSRRADRSRDPLYNQLKMYSEVYRMLGWMRPLPSQRLHFTITLLGETIAFDATDDPAYTFGLVRESLLSIVFPNTTTMNIGVASQRPFVWLLMLMKHLGGIITRHEMVLGLLAVVDDRAPHAMEQVVKVIKTARKGSQKGLILQVDQFASAQGVQRNTLENYTRFPVGVLKSPAIGWGKPVTRRDLYGDHKPAVALELTPEGARVAATLQHRQDVREYMLLSYPADVRAAFANYGFYAFLLRSGLAEQEVTSSLIPAEEATKAIRSDLFLNSALNLIYSPFVQENDDVLDLSEQLDDAL